MKNQKKYNFMDLLKIVSTLSAPNGCPWDREQTHKSIRVNTIEEAYEVVDAIDRDDREAMIEELGDLLLQSVFHADIARRAGKFDINDILNVLCDKLISRHSHIFGEDSASGADESVSVWEKNKAKEKGHASLKAKLESIPSNLPALMRAQKVIKKLNTDQSKKSKIKLITVEQLQVGLITLIQRSIQSGIDAELALNQAVKNIIDGASELI